MSCVRVRAVCAAFIDVGQTQISQNLQERIAAALIPARKAKRLQSPQLDFVYCGPCCLLMLLLHAQ
jgi:hypothetical protein